MTLAIIGAAGAIGRSTAEACHAAGQPVRLVGRHAAPLKAMAREGDEIVLADVSTPEGCRDALAGAETALYALGLPYTTAAFAAYPAMMRSFCEAAGQAGLRRAVLITNVYPYGRPQTARVAEDHPRVPVAVKGEYRKQQEDLFLGASGFEAISLRLPDFYGPRVESSLLTDVAKAARAGGTGTLLGPADLPHEFVYTPDVGPVVRALLSHPGKVAGAYNLAGAGPITVLALAELLFKAAGQQPKLRVLAPWMQSLIGLFMPVLRELGEMRYLMETPVLLDDAKLRALLPRLRKTPYADGALATVRGGNA